MKRINGLWMVALAFVVTPALAQTTGNANLFLGQKTLDENDWNVPYDEQLEMGILFDVRGQEWPVSFAADLLASAHTESYWFGDLTASTSELDLGVRKVFEFPGSMVHPYIGGGLAFLSARIEYASGSYVSSVQDSGTGIWLNGGIAWTLGQNFNLGLDFRHSQGDVSLGGVTVDAGGSHAGILLGYHW